MPSFSQKVIAAAKDRALRAFGLDIKAEYIPTPPSAQNSLDLFAGEWASRLPPPFENLVAGESRLFEDARIEWLRTQLGDISAFNVLECGPLEGGHAYMLEKLGVASVLSVEASTRAFLRCLVLKELLGTKRSQFVLGDFVRHLQSERRYDLILACGVLYHLVDPVKAIALMAKASDRLYVWTHYYDESAIKAHPKLSHHFTASSQLEHEGFEYSLHRQHYQSRLGNPGFMGGAERFSNWVDRKGLLGCLKHFGYSKVMIQFDEVDGAAGPNISLYAER